MGFNNTFDEDKFTLQNKSLTMAENSEILDEPFFITFTTIGITANLVALIIIINRGLFKDGVWMYIACLAVCDSLMLILSFFYELAYVKNSFGLDLKKYKLLCRLFPGLIITIRQNKKILSFPVSRPTYVQKHRPKKFSRTLKAKYSFAFIYSFHLLSIFFQSAYFHAIV